MGDNEPGGANYNYRKPRPEELVNPFDNNSKTTGVLTMKYCAWEVLRDYPRGLTVKLVVDEMQARRLRVFTGKANPTGQVSGDMSRDTDHFFHYKNSNIWTITPFVPRDVLAEGTSHDRRRQRGSKADDGGGSGCGVPATKKKKKRGGGYGGRRRAATSSDDVSDLSEPFVAVPASPRPPPSMSKHELVGLRCQIWWDSTQTFYNGHVSGYNSEDDTYEVEYEDGEVDYALRLLDYEVRRPGGRKAVVTVRRSIEETTGRGPEDGADDGGDEAEEHTRAAATRRGRGRPSRRSTQQQQQQQELDSHHLRSLTRMADVAEQESRAAWAAEEPAYMPPQQQQQQRYLGRRGRAAYEEAEDARMAKQPRRGPPSVVQTTLTDGSMGPDRMSSLLSLTSLPSGVLPPAPQMAGAALAASLNQLGMDGGGGDAMTALAAQARVSHQLQQQQYQQAQMQQQQQLQQEQAATRAGGIGDRAARGNGVPPAPTMPAPAPRRSQPLAMAQQLPRNLAQVSPFLNGSPLNDGGQLPAMATSAGAAMLMMQPGAPAASPATTAASAAAAAAGGSGRWSGERRRGSSRRHLERVPTEEVLRMTGSELLQLGGLDSLPSMSFSTVLQAVGVSEEAAAAAAAGGGGGAERSGGGADAGQVQRGGGSTRETPFKLCPPPAELQPGFGQGEENGYEMEDDGGVQEVARGDEDVLIDRPLLAGGPSWKLPARQQSEHTSDSWKTGFTPPEQQLAAQQQQQQEGGGARNRALTSQQQHRIPRRSSFNRFSDNNRR